MSGNDLPVTLPGRDVFRVVSWNVNGLRAALDKGFLSWLDASDADVIGLQEARTDVLPAALSAHVGSFGGPPKFHVDLFPAERKGYSGVALLARRPWDHLERALAPEFDNEGRLQIARFGRLTIAGGYFPNGNGKERDNSRVPYKLRFYQQLFDRLEPARLAGEPILVMGDFNTAHRPIDLARPKDNQKTSGFLPEERAEVDRWLSNGWTDTFRHFHPDERDRYSWWSQRFGVRAKNVGWRLDMVFASPGALPYLRRAFIDSHVLGSDHCPVGVDLDPAVLGG